MQIKLKRYFQATFFLLSLASFGLSSDAAEWSPTQTLEFVVPAGPGGALDQVGREVQQFFEKTQRSKFQMIVVNKGGGNGKIAFDILRQKTGDPHFLTINTTGYMSNYLIGNLDILPHRELTPLAILQDEYLVLAVRADSPIKNLSEVIQKLKNDPSSLRIAVATSIGNHIHVGTAKALKAAGIDITKIVVVPFRSSSDSVLAMIGGHIELVAATTPNVVSMVQAGKIRLLAVSSEKRLGGVFSSTPTWRESGVDSDFHSTLGILAPKGLSQDQIDYWQTFFKNLSSSKEWQGSMEKNQSHSHFIPIKDTTSYYEQEFLSVKEIVGDLKLLGSAKN
jgi:putative tricarboxylic transport membrane protein